MYPTQYTSRMGTARVREEVGADTRVIVKEYEIWKERNVGTIRGNSLKQDLTNARDLTQRDESPLTID